MAGQDKISCPAGSFLFTSPQHQGNQLTEHHSRLGSGGGASRGQCPVRTLAQLPESINLIFGGSGIVPAALFAIILNIILPKDEKTEVEMAEEILAEKKEMESK